MKKSLFIMFVAVSALLVCLVACKPGPSTPVETGEDGFIHVSTWAEFEQGLVDAKSTDKKTVILDNNLTFDSTTYKWKAGLLQGIQYHTPRMCNTPPRRGTAHHRKRGKRHHIFHRMHAAVQVLPEPPDKQGWNRKRSFHRRVFRYLP